MVQIILLDKIIKYVFIFLVLKKVSRWLLQNESLQGDETAIYSISQRVDLNIEHISQVFMKRVVFSALKYFGVLIDGSVPTSLTKTFPCLMCNIAWVKLWNSALTTYGGLSVHTPQIYCLILSGWVLKFFLPNIQ